MTRRKFKVGDKVVIKKESVYGPKGVVGTVVNYNNTKYTVEFTNGFRHMFRGAELDYYVEPVKKPAKTKKVEKKEPKFKVGDIVRGISDRYRITGHDMTKGEVTKCYETVFWVKVLEHPNKRYIGVEFPVNYDGFEKVTEKEEPKNTVVIYQRDRDVVALDKTTGQKCFAHCHPDDAFDFKTGAKIAFGRLIGEPVEEKTVPKEEPIKYVDRFEKGKTYIFDKETYKSYQCVKDVPDWVDYCDGEVVKHSAGFIGTIGRYIVSSNWCKEVTPKKVEPKETHDEFEDAMYPLLEAFKKLFE